MFSPTSHDGLLKVSGSDAEKFLQGQLTCDVNAITGTETSLGAHCNPQGRVISLFRLFFYQEAYYLLMPAPMVEITLKALKKYAVFFKVNMCDASAELLQIAEKFPLRKYADILNGIPAIYPETSGKFLPHDLNLPSLQAVNFHKGCYTGQEIIARMHYKAILKNRLYHATIQAIVTIQPGLEVYCYRNQDKQVAGTIVDVNTLDSTHHVLLLADSKSAQNEHLFLAQNDQIFFTLLS